MPLFSNPYTNFIIETLLAELLITIIGFLFAQTIIKWLNNKRYGGWHMTVLKNDEKIIDHRKVSTLKMKQVLEIPEEMPVFLKGMCSPFHHINCDLMGCTDNEGILTIDKDLREIIVNLDKDGNGVDHKNDLSVL